MKTMTIEKEGKTYEILADGTIHTQGLPDIKPGTVHDIPEKILAVCKERNLSTTGKCYYSGCVINRCIAEAAMEAAAIHRKNKKQKLLAAVPGLEELKAARDEEADRKSTRLNSSHIPLSRMPSSARKKKKKNSNNLRYS